MKKTEMGFDHKTNWYHINIICRYMTYLFEISVCQDAFMRHAQNTTSKIEKLTNREIGKLRPISLFWKLFGLENRGKLESDVGHCTMERWEGKLKISCSFEVSALEDDSVISLCKIASYSGLV